MVLLFRSTATRNTTDAILELLVGRCTARAVLLTDQRVAERAEVTVSG